MTLKLRDKACIEKRHLIVGSWYRGAGRNSHVALWDGNYFLTFGQTFGEWKTKIEGHWDDGGPFQPFEAL